MNAGEGTLTLNLDDRAWEMSEHSMPSGVSVRACPEGQTNPIPKANKWMMFGLVLAVVGIFGPYLGGPVRLEQFVTYPLAFICAAATVRKWRLNFPFICLCTFLSMYFIGIALVGLTNPELPPGLESRSYFGGLDTALMPLAIACIALSARTVLSLRQILRTVIVTLSLMLSLNTVLAILQMNGLVSLGSFWVDPNLVNDIGDLGTVAMRAETNLRFGGVFNQPGEAGAAYASALMALALVPYFSARERLFLLPPLLVGGLLPGSKIFLVALVVVLVALLLDRARGRLLSLLTIMLGGLVLWFVLGDLSEALIARLSSGKDVVQSFTAGRLGDNGSLGELVNIVTDNSPLVGFGAAGLNFAYDSQAGEALANLGLLGLALWLLIGVTVAVSCWIAVTDVRTFSRAFCVWLLLASLGLGVFTANRVGALVWLIVMPIMLSVGRSDAREDPHEIHRQDSTLSAGVRHS